jgi:hypothetical protein
VLVKGQLYMSWPSGDEGCLRLAMVQLSRCGLGNQEDLAAAFGRHITSVQRYVADFASAGLRGLVPERRGPKGAWKLTPELRGKILWIVLREGIGKLEAIQQRLAEAWQEEVSLKLESGGGDRSPSTGIGGCSEVEKGSGSQPSQAPGGDGSGWPREARRSYSRAQRIYLDRLEQGEENAYAGGLLLTPLLARYRFVSTLRQVITIGTHEGYSLDELGLTLFYLDLFGVSVAGGF